MTAFSSPLGRTMLAPTMRFVSRPTTCARMNFTKTMYLNPPSSSFSSLSTHRASVGGSGYRRIFQQTASSMIFGNLVLSGTTTAAVMTFCDDGSGKGDDEDILTKIKNMVSDGLGGKDGMDFEGKFNDIASTVGSKVQDAVDTGVPTQLSYGFVCGFCSGYAMRKVGQIGAVVFGMGFCALQTLSYYGYVQVDHNRIKKDFEGLMDLNNDGKIDQEDVNILSEKVMKVISYNVPGGSGFAAGFIGGIRSGR